MIKTTIPALSLCVLLAGCGGEPTAVTATPDASLSAPAEQTADKAEVAAPGAPAAPAESAVAVEGAEMPAGFPADVPIYPGVKDITDMSAMSGQPDRIKMVIMETTDSLEKVTKFYEDEMKRQGWELSETQTNLKGVAALSGKKPDRTASVDINGKKAGTTKISLTVIGFPNQ